MKIKYQFFTSVIIWYQFFTSVSNWYWFFTFVKIEYQCFRGAKNLYRFFSFVKIEYQLFTSEKNRTNPSQIYGTNKYQFFTVKNEKDVKFEHRLLDPQNYRNWPNANFTFSKSDVLVPILHTFWNFRNVKFAVQHLAQNLMQPFSHPNDAPDEILFQSACLSRRYLCLKVWTDGGTHACTDGRRLESHPIRFPSLRLTWAKNQTKLRLFF